MGYTLLILLVFVVVLAGVIAFINKRYSALKEKYDMLKIDYDRLLKERDVKEKAEKNAKEEKQKINTGSDIDDFNASISILQDNTRKKRS